MGGQWEEGGKGKGGNAQTAAQRHARSDSGREERLMCRKTHCITYIVYDENVKKTHYLANKTFWSIAVIFFQRASSSHHLQPKAFPMGIAQPNLTQQPMLSPLTNG